jgi:predicted transcriptional regulator
LTFYFSYQHAHFQNDIDELILYINCFLSDDYVALEFFDGDKDIFGGGVSLQDVDIFSADAIAARFGHNADLFNYYIDRSKSKAISYKARSWSGLHDVDAVIRKEGNSYIVERAL